jgi:hypothetical protein
MASLRLKHCRMKYEPSPAAERTYLFGRNSVFVLKRGEV